MHVCNDAIKLSMRRCVHLLRVFWLATCVRKNILICSHLTLTAFLCGRNCIATLCWNVWLACVYQSRTSSYVLLWRHLPVRNHLIIKCMCTRFTKSTFMTEHAISCVMVGIDTAGVCHLFFFEFSQLLGLRLEITDKKFAPQLLFRAMGDHFTVVFGFTMLFAFLSALTEPNRLAGSTRRAVFWERTAMLVTTAWCYAEQKTSLHLTVMVWVIEMLQENH